MAPKYRARHVKTGGWGSAPRPVSTKNIWASRDPRIVTFTFTGGRRIYTRREAVPAWEALDAVMAHHNYKIVTAGSYAYRNTARGTPSAHKWGTALDINPPANPYRGAQKLASSIPTIGPDAADWIDRHGIWPDSPTDYPPKMLSDTLRVLTLDGKPLLGVLRGTSVTDLMHWVPQVNANEVSVDWDTVAGGRPNPDKFTRPDRQDTSTVPLVTLRLGARGALVTKLQAQLSTDGYGVTIDGHFGPATRSAVRAFQRTEGLDTDGVVGLTTWKALLAPSLGEQTPDKRSLIEFSAPWVEGQLIDTPNGMWLLLADGAVWGAPWAGGPNADPAWTANTHGLPAVLDRPRPGDPPGTLYAVIGTTGRRATYGKPRP